MQKEFQPKLTNKVVSYRIVSQVGRIRQVFEKKNQKSAHAVARLQHKLEQYHRRAKDAEGGGKTGPREPGPPGSANGSGSGGSSGGGASQKESGGGSRSKEGSLRDVSATGRHHPPQHHPALDKVKTIGPGVSLSPPFFFNKSREIANLIRNKFGSADNIAHLKSSMETGAGLQAEGGAARTLSGSANTVASKAPKYTSDDECCSTGTSASADSNGNRGSGAGSLGRSDPQAARLGEVLEVVREIREAQAQLVEDMEAMKSQLKEDYGYFTSTIQEERYR